MRIITFRDVPFVDREKEEEFLLDRFREQSEKILFIYGPKSSGKTTLMEYILENALEKDENLYVNYVNFRRFAISNYKDFLDIYFKPIREDQKSWLNKIVEKLPLKLGLFRGSASLPVKGVSFGLNIELYNQLQKNEADPFVILMEVLEKIKLTKMPILILDEVQTLEGIYMNGEIQKKHLLTEFFNFLVSLTKEKHVAHVVVMTSETLFLEKIYNHSKLAETTDFYKIDHLDYEQAREWMKFEGLEDDVINLIWEYVGGSAHRIKDAIKIARKGDGLKNYLINEAVIYRGKMSQFVLRCFENKKEIDCFEQILEQMLQHGYFLQDRNDKLQYDIINKAVAQEFLFLDPQDERITFNSRIIYKAAELFLQH